MTGRHLRIYLDYNATAPLSAASREAMIMALDAPGNPSSVHGAGRAARALVETAREHVASLAGLAPDTGQVVFTSGASEANATALTPEWTTPKGACRFARLLVGAVEHPSVLAGGRFSPDAIEILPVDGDGRVRPDDIRAALAQARNEGAACLVAVMAANNETGVIQPVADIGALVGTYDGLLHVDAVQAAGRFPIDMEAWNCASLSLSAHKIGGPLGAGALVLRDAHTHPAPLMAGGGQERRLRAGTENVPGIVGFGAAAVKAHGTYSARARIATLRQRLEDGLVAIDPATVVFARTAPRLDNTVCFARLGVKAELALIALDLEGVAVSSGAACSSGKVGSSTVLAAMKVDPRLAAGAIRVSIGPATRAEEIDAFLEIWDRISKRLAAQGARAGRRAA